MLSLKDNKLQIPDTGSDSIHPNKNHERAVDWVFVTDALNFCFWSLDKESQWTVNGYTGYLALEAALHRAINVSAINVIFHIKIISAYHIYQNTRINILNSMTNVLHVSVRVDKNKFHEGIGILGMLDFR